MTCWAIGLIRFAGIAKLGKGVRPTPPALPVRGSYSWKFGYAALTSLKSPARIAAVGTPHVCVNPRRSWKRSQDPKKNSLFFMIGPPRVPP